MASLLKLIIALAIIASAFILVSFIGYLLTNTDVTFKMVTQYPGTYFVALILSIIALIMHFGDELDKKALH